MTATDRIITLAWLAKWSAPGGDVRLCNGGFVDHAGERYMAQHPVYGSVADWPELAIEIGDMAESATITLAPSPTATLSDWWRLDLFGTRLRLWHGEVAGDLLTVPSAQLLGDYLVDNVSREQTADGGDLLVLDLIGRTERLFLSNEGNVCSDRFHKSVWAGEAGFANCTDVQGYFAWGAEDTPREDQADGKKVKKKKNK